MTSLLTAIRARISSRIACAAAVTAMCAVALGLRVIPRYNIVFAGDWVRFAENDPWYHMRLVENLLHNFPNLITFDPFTVFPHGQDVWFAPFYDLLLGLVVWLIGAGSPGRHLMEVVGAYFPAVLGALTVVPVYFLGRELFGRGAGLLAAGLIAILPGEFFVRSVLGFSDHHVAEILFSTTAILFLVLAVRTARERATDFGHLRHGDWRRFGRPLVFALLAGVFLGFYMLSWVGGLAFVGIIGLYAIVEYLVNHLRGRPTHYLSIVFIPLFLLALVMLSPFRYVAYQDLGAALLGLGILAFALMGGLSWLMARRGLRRVYYPAAVAGLGIAGFGAVYLIAPSLFEFMLIPVVGVFTPGVAARTISEVQPLLSPAGVFTLDIAWRYFTAGFFIAPVSLGLIVWTMVRDRNTDRALLVVWSLVILAATLTQMRFAYYYAVNVALLTGYLSARLLAWSGFFKLRVWETKEGSGPEKIRESRKEKRARKRAERKRGATASGGGYVLPLVTAAVVFFGVFYPNFGHARELAALAALGPSDDWHSALEWMRHETPDPFDDPGYYYQPYDRPPAGESYRYPESAYGIMSWWDYGHWITYIAQRIPNANPHQVGAAEVAGYLIAQDEPSANERLERLGSRYVVIDFSMVMGKFYAIAIWAGEDDSRYLERYYTRGPDGALSHAVVFYPEYYRSMCARLYSFGGHAVVPEDSTMVISYTEEPGLEHKVITAAESFSTYEEAITYLEAQDGPNHRLVGTDPFASAVPLEALEHYEQVFASPSVRGTVGDHTISEVQVFEYRPEGIGH